MDPACEVSRKIGIETPDFTSSSLKTQWLQITLNLFIGYFCVGLAVLDMLFITADFNMNAVDLQM